MNNFNTSSVKLSRVFAFILDIVFSLLITFTLLFLTIVTLGYSGEFSSNPDSVDYIFGVFRIFPYLLLLRDFIFGGRSLGKRLLKLQINDFTTREKPKLIKTALRGLLTIFLFPIELIYLILEGRTLGDRIANTVVIYNCANPKLNRSDSTPEHSKKRKVIITALCVILLLSVVLVPLSITLSSPKTDPQYSIALDYFLNSDSFEFSYESSDQIECKELNTNVEFSHGGNIEQTKEFVFTAKNRIPHSVILHSENGNWYVCDECTRFY